VGTLRASLGIVPQEVNFRFHFFHQTIHLNYKQVYMELKKKTESQIQF
jgi:hypothetical protein